MSLLVGLALALTVPAVSAPGPCDLLDPAAASALIGEAIKAGTPTPPAPDEDTGGTMSHCTHRGAKSMVIVSLVTFDNAAAARKATTKELGANASGKL